MALSPPMRAGKLRHRVEIHRCTEANNAQGGVVRTFAKLATVWASVSPEEGTEEPDAERPLGRVKSKVVMRHYEGLKPKDRLKWGTRIFEIQNAMDMDERRVEMRLTCVEVVD